MRHIQTLASAYRAICQGERPWTALGDFLNEWLDYSKDAREALIAEPITLPPGSSDEQARWAAFCAATAEWLCLRDQVPCPAWIGQSEYRLPGPWFHAIHPEHPAVRERLIRQTPEPFRRRNIYCGERVFANKYQLAT